jgi:hypothetical protein
MFGGMLLMAFGVYIVINGVEVNDPDSVDVGDVGMYYGEMWNWTSNLTAWSFPIVTDSVYYNLTNLSEGNVYGFTFTQNNIPEGGSYLTTEQAGLYKTSLAFSYSSIGTGLYGISVAKNFNQESSRDCYARRSITSPNTVGSVTVSCLLDLNVGDTINVQMEDEESPVKDVLIHSVNLNLVKVGSL